jgi:hypothetical protein
MCHADQRRADTLSIVLLGIRTSFKEDLQASVAELVYGEHLPVLATCGHQPPALCSHRTSSTSSAGVCSTSAQSRQRAATLRLHAFTRIYRILHTSSCGRIQPAAHWTPPPPLQRSTQRPFTQGEDPPTLRAWQDRHRVSLQGQTSVHAARGRTQDCHHRNPAEANTAGCGPKATSHADRTPQSPRPLPGSVQHLRGNLRGGGGGMWELSQCTEQLAG